MHRTTGRGDDPSSGGSGSVPSRPVNDIAIRSVLTLPVTDSVCGWGGTTTFFGRAALPDHRHPDERRPACPAASPSASSPTNPQPVKPVAAVPCWAPKANSVANPSSE
jgi:hypothetical protein